MEKSVIERFLEARRVKAERSAALDEAKAELAEAERAVISEFTLDMITSVRDKASGKLLSLNTKTRASGAQGKEPLIEYLSSREDIAPVSRLLAGTPVEL